MDERRLDSMEVLGEGILNRPVPKTDIPNRPKWSPRCLDDQQSLRPDVLRELEAGLVIEAPNYYGIPIIWRTDGREYRCILLQYRKITEDQTFLNAEDAVDWFLRIYAATQ